MTSATPTSSFTTFVGFRRTTQGPLAMNALAVHRLQAERPADTVLVFSDATGTTIDVDVSGREEEVAARYGAGNRDQAAPGNPLDGEQGCDAPGQEAARSRGRPKLGVVAREVTLLPRHWDWLATQPGGASVALRKLVDEARRANQDKDRLRQAHTRAYHFMSAIGGDLPGFEEASRALFANDRSRLEELTGHWPADVRTHLLWLATVNPDEQAAD